MEPRREKTKEDIMLLSVYSSGFNIYQCLHRLKRQLGFSKDFKFPAEVVVKVCNQYFKDSLRIKNQWSWFVKVFTRESEKYHAKENIRINEESKTVSYNKELKDLIKSITTKHSATELEGNHTLT